MPLAQQDEAPALGPVSRLPLPRFVSLRTEPVNMRTGPGTRYPVDWVYARRGLPVEIIGEFDVWRQIRDQAGDEGWVHQSMLSGQRTALVVGELSQPVRKGSTDVSAVVAMAEPGAQVIIERCPREIGLCEISADGVKGWIARDALWGLYPGERLD